jgi:hypothetical protein
MNAAKLDSVHENETGFGDLLATLSPLHIIELKPVSVIVFAENNAE